ncbi:MAG: hypothetical protein R3F23_04380 [Verrucomicrobiia bacterium]
MKKKTRNIKKTNKKVFSKKDVEFCLKLPQNLLREFQRASQKIKKEYDYDISPELLMVWILSEIQEDYLIKEFEEALALRSAAKQSGRK